MLMITVMSCYMCALLVYVLYAAIYTSSTQIHWRPIVSDYRQYTIMALFLAILYSYYLCIYHTNIHFLHS